MSDQPKKPKRRKYTPFIYPRPKPFQTFVTPPSTQSTAKPSMGMRMEMRMETGMVQFGGTDTKQSQVMKLSPRMRNKPLSLAEIQNLLQFTGQTVVQKGICDENVKNL